MIKYNAVISTDAQGKIEIVVNEDNESFDFEAESTIYLGACFSDYELNELLEKNFAHIKRIKRSIKQTCKRIYIIEKSLILISI